MCLYVKPEARMKTAKKDIVCYKVLRKSVYTDRSFNYITPFYEMIIEMGKTYDNTNGTVNFHVLDKKKCTPFENVIEEGYHSFKKLKDAKKFCGEISRHIVVDVVVRCVIPKGANYYVGNCCFVAGSRLKSYVSDKIKYIEEV